MSRLRVVAPPWRHTCQVCGVVLTGPAHHRLCLKCWRWCQLGAALRTAARCFREERR
ncbi:MAG: hypothetical protein P9F75_09285 [Candidatus Contendobacter sp.]|nr:hypothetical protein [Candidatus Contendobacter sp.]